GLAISKRLTELMGGSIGVTSRPGEGSLFWFSIRALRRRRDAARGFVPTAPVPTYEAAKKDFRILLVEDNNINQKVAIFMLKSLGYTAEVARNGKDASARIGCDRYARILMACQMPEMDALVGARSVPGRA